MNRTEKHKVVESLHAAWLDSSSGVVAQYRGLSVGQSEELRGELHQAGVSIQVVKNTLARRAAEDTALAAAKPLFSGPVVIAFGNDAVAIAKAMSDFAKKHKALEIQGGVLDGKLVDIAQVTALAKLPSREVLLAKMLGSMQAPITGFVRTLSEVPASFVRILAAVRDQKQAA
ncbi:MAG: 50S ribosomal protein L10 [Mariprofundales bacterium]|nr:50S ribosomal protein L10 [Mariprofundales bacterium]